MTVINLRSTNLKKMKLNEVVDKLVERDDVHGAILLVLSKDQSGMGIYSARLTFQNQVNLLAEGMFVARKAIQEKIDQEEQKK